MAPSCRFASRLARPIPSRGSGGHGPATDQPGEAPPPRDETVPRAPPLSLTRHFALVSGVTLAASAAFLSLLCDVIATRELVLSAERNNVAMTGLFQAGLMRTSPRFLGGLIPELKSPGGL
jgi:hypothetical protein